MWSTFSEAQLEAAVAGHTFATGKCGKIQPHRKRVFPCHQSYVAAEPQTLT